MVIAIMNGEQFSHLSGEIKDLRIELTARLDSFLEKLDNKPDKDHIEAFHTRLTKHQSEYEQDVRDIRKELDALKSSTRAEIGTTRAEIGTLQTELTEDVHSIEKRQEKTETKLSIFWKIFAGVGFILGVLSQSSWFMKFLGG